jgi:hypothetical protein
MSQAEAAFAPPALMRLHLEPPQFASPATIGAPIAQSASAIAVLRDISPSVRLVQPALLTACLAPSDPHAMSAWMDFQSMLTPDYVSLWVEENLVL